MDETSQMFPLPVPLRSLAPSPLAKILLKTLSAALGLPKGAACLSRTG
jgi:hypothetical protein